METYDKHEQLVLWVTDSASAAYSVLKGYTGDMAALPILRRIMELADEKQLVITALWVPRGRNIIPREGGCPEVAAHKPVAFLAHLDMQLFAHIVRESALGIEGGQVSGGHPTTLEHQGFECAPGCCGERYSGQRAVISIDTCVADQALLDCV